MSLTYGSRRALLRSQITLQPVALVSTFFSVEDENGAVITGLTGWSTGSSLQFIPTSGGDAGKIVIIDDAEADFAVCVGSTVSSLGTISGVIRETNPRARNSPNDTAVTFTCKAFDYYVDPIDGSPANNGLTQGTAFLAVANAPTGTPDIFVGVRPVVNRETYTVTTAGMYIRPWTKGARAAMWGSVSHTSGFTQVGATNEWKKTLGYVALNVFEVSAVTVGATVTKFIKGTVGALTAGQFGTNATEVFVYSVADPNGRLFEIPKNDASAIGLNALTANRARWAQIDTWFCPANGLDASSNDVTHYGMDSSYNGNDASGGQGTAQNYREYWFIFRRNGQARTTSGAAGDGGSRHLTSTGLRYVGTIIDNEKEGIGDQRRTSVKNSRLYMENNNNEYVILDEGGATPAGRHRLTNSIIVVTTTDVVGGSGVNCCQSASGLPSPVFDVLNVTLYLKGGATRTGLSVRNGIVTVKNLIIEGAWNRGIDFRGADTGSMVNTNICIHGATTPYFNNGAPGVVAGPNSFTTDPKLVDPINGDFRLQASSPCVATGAPVGLTLDYAGVPWAAIPNMGAYQTTG